jgi:hypothetical protein
MQKRGSEGGRRGFTGTPIHGLSLTFMVLIPRSVLRAVIPAKAGIQVVPFFLDTRLRGCDGCNDSSTTPQLAAALSLLTSRSPAGDCAREYACI